MHFNRITEQAICIMLMLYFQDRRIYLNSKEISERLDVSPTYLKKIMRKLVINKLVKASTGIGGGYKYFNNKNVSLYSIYKAINGEVDLFVLKTDNVCKIFKGVKQIENRYNSYLKFTNIINASLKYSLENVSIEDIALEVLKKSSSIRLDWNNWELEFERIYKKEK